VLFYILIFLVVGFVIGLFTSEKRQETALIIYCVISFGWFLVWGPYAILTFIELIVGDSVARKLKSQSSIIENLLE